MKIGLYNLEPKINNSAMMQVSYYQKKFARWVNNKAIFNKVAWEDFEI